MPTTEGAYPVASVTDAVQPFLHRRGPVSFTRDSINETAIRYFCEVVEDGNPAYWDGDFAAKSRFGRLIAPPQALMSMTFPAWWTPGYIQKKQAHDSAARSLRANATRP